MKKYLFFFMMTAAFAVSAGNNLIKNADFKKIKTEGVPENWFIHGKTETAAKDGKLTLSLPADCETQNQATVMQHLKDVLKTGESYTLTCDISAPSKTSAHVYVEGSYLIGDKKHYFITKAPFFPVDKNGIHKKITFSLPAEMERVYVALRSGSRSVPVTFSNVKLVSIQSSADANFLKNADFKKIKADGVPENWFIHGKTETAAKNGKLTLSLPADRGNQRQAVIMQHLKDTLFEGVSYTFSCDVVSDADTAAQIYIEGLYKVNGKTKSMITEFRPFAVNSKGVKHTISFTVPGKMDRIYLAMKTTDPAIPVTFSNVKIVSRKNIPEMNNSGNLLINADFKKNDKGVPSGWFIHGKTIAEIKNNSLTLKLPEKSGQKQATIMQHLNKTVSAGKTYVFTCRISAPCNTAAQIYFEGNYTLNGARKGFQTDSPWVPASSKISERKITFTVPAKMDRFYLSLRTTDPAVPITFSDLKLVEYKVKNNVIGGYWEQQYPGSPSKGALVPAGKSVVLKQVPVKPGKTYRMTYKVSGSGETGNKDYCFHEYKVSTRPMIDGGLAFQEIANSTAPKVQILRIPPEEQAFFLDITFASQTHGELIFDDFKIEEYVRSPMMDWHFFFTEPCYRNTVYPATDTGKIAGRVAAGTPAVKAEVVIKGIGKANFELENGKGGFEIAAKNIAVGKYPATCRLFDRNGKEIKKFELTLRKVPHAENQVLFDRRQAMQINGKPFFPISEYRSRTGFLKGGFYHMARKGINTFILTNLTADEKLNLSILDRLHQFGMKAIIEIWSASSITPEGKERFKKRYNALFTPAVRQHPAFLAYFTNDEPFACGRSPYPIIWTRDFIHDADPYHPVWVGQSPRDAEVDNLRPYADGSDITGIDIYPVPVPHPHCDLPDKSINCIGEYTRRITEVVHGLKPVWMALQAFNWHDHNFIKSNRRSVYPTEDELRFMYFDAIFNGSRGLTLYGSNRIKSMPFRLMLEDIIKELYHVSGLVTNSDAMADLPHDNPKIRIARRSCGGKIYYGIFNQLPEEKNITFDSDKTLVIYREYRKLVPENGKIKIKMRPHEVIICGSDPLPPPSNTLPPCNAELEDIPDPAHEYIRQLNGLIPDIFISQQYQGNANWIWNKDQIKTASGSCVLVKKFDISSIPEKAVLRFCADDEADAFINGQFAGNGDEHGRLKEYDVTGFLKKGQNILLINARDGGGLPCAMLAEFQIDGKVFFVSDDSWQARAAEAGEKFDTAKQNLPTTPAFVIAPHGKGPWGTILLPDGF